MLVYQSKDPYKVQDSSPLCQSFCRPKRAACCREIHDPNYYHALFGLLVARQRAAGSRLDSAREGGDGSPHFKPPAEDRPLAEKIMSRFTRSTRVVAAGVLSAAAFWIVQVLPAGIVARNADTMVRAGLIMEQALFAIRTARTRSGIHFHPALDPNQTGLIGPEISPIITTLGELEAKRSTTNPNMAGFLVTLLDRAGVKAGDSIAIGSSGSFPALLIASLAAARAMDVHPVAILSLGASSYGAGDPEFNLLDIFEILEREKICSVHPAAASLGGENDVGSDFDPQVRKQLVRRIGSSGIPLIEIPDLRQNTAARYRIYQRAARGKIAAFINSGGGFANLGASPLVLKLKPGLNTDVVQPKEAERGMIQLMAAQGVPVIHLLYVKGLIREAGLPWDPIPLPKPAVIHPAGSTPPAGFWLVAGGYFALLAVLAGLRDK